ncbi:hypothetical protein [Pedobacter caeni]|uniref:Uncharacterized protein n=1 Tax=Pedobacter caeni TaxID=288992 RepID=A0A1M5NB10_9SPHI|nr:hypothetical protein [Pedobacter caeni]SHG86379.1 hypothetical protein SAMN04488522_10847 [Pedobacter caeni]
MKRTLTVLTVLLLAVVLIGPSNHSFAKTNKKTESKTNIKSEKKVKKSQTMIPLMARNSTVDGVYVQLWNTTSGGHVTYFLPPNTPNPIVLGYLQQNNDIYNVSLSSTGGAHDMWIYWEHKTNVTGLVANGMALACVSCADIRIFN